MALRTDVRGHTLDLTPVALSQCGVLHHELLLYSQTIFSTQPSSKMYSPTWIMTWQAVCQAFKEWTSGDTCVQISQALWRTPTLHLNNKSTIWDPHLIWAFLKALGILGCRVASATLPRSVSEGKAALMRTSGAEGGGVWEQGWRRRRAKCYEALKLSLTDKSCITKTFVYTLWHTLWHRVNPLMFTDLPLLTPVLSWYSFSSTSISSPWRWDVIMQHMAVGGPLAYKDPLYVLYLWIIWMQGSDTADTFTLSCASLAAA